MKQFCFTVDDNVRFLRELNAGRAESIFDHPYLALYRRLHERFGLKIQLNLFLSGFPKEMLPEALRLAAVRTVSDFDI